MQINLKIKTSLMQNAKPETLRFCIFNLDSSLQELHENIYMNLAHILMKLDVGVTNPSARPTKDILQQLVCEKKAYEVWLRARAEN